MRKRLSQLIAAGVLGGQNIQYLLNDDFTGTVAAGSVNGTTATPTGQTRSATDTNSKISIGSGVLSFATGEAANDGVYYAAITRAAGQVLFSEITPAGGTIEVGWDTVQGGLINDTISLAANQIRVRLAAGTLIVVGAYATGTSYKFACVQRASGYHYFVMGGAFANWTLLYSVTGVTGNKAIGISAASTDAVATLSFVRVPQDKRTITPLASDAFTRADAAIGTTGGGGSEETGGSGLTWAAVGTWNVASNAAVCAALSGGLGIVTVPAGSINVIVEAVVTRSAGVAGVVLRYQDASNYIIAYHDGTNIKLDKVVGGSTTNLVSVATTYSAGARLIVSASATKFRVYYNNVLRGTEQTVSDAALQTTGSHGLYTTDTSNTFDDFVVWSKGDGGEYNIFGNYANP